MKNRLNVLISHVGIPSDKIGSWNVLLTNFIKNNPSVFDYIISPEPAMKINGVSIIVKESVYFKYYITNNIIKYYEKKKYWMALNNIMKSNEDVTVVVFDDLKILKTIDYFAKKKGIRKRLRIIFFLRGYRFNLNLEEKNNLYNCIDKLIIQTNDSYLNQLKENHTIPCEVEILPNGVNSKIFHPLSEAEKKKLKKELGFSNEKINFLWVSQDRPKKGLAIILKAWKRLVEKHDNIELIIIGTYNEIIGESIIWLERKPNNELADYYQITDYYLFSSLCHEGHPLSLTEAVKCGAKCLASNINPVNEILHEGDLGVLVDKPNIVESWVRAIDSVIADEVDFNKKNVDLTSIYDFQNWELRIKEIFND